MHLRGTGGLRSQFASDLSCVNLPTISQGVTSVHEREPSGLDQAPIRTSTTSMKGANPAGVSVDVHSINSGHSTADESSSLGREDEIHQVSH